MKVFLVVCLSAVLTGAVAIFAFPSNVCGSTRESVPVCSAVSALRLCSNISVGRPTRDGRENPIELSGNFTTAADVSVQIVVLSSEVVRVLAERVFSSSTAIAGAIQELIQRFNWHRITILADVEDPYFLHTAEKLYRIASLSPDSSLLQLVDSDSAVEDLVSQVERLKLRIVILSLRSHLSAKLLCSARERHLVWPEYAWIVHSVDVNGVYCGDRKIPRGVISVRLNDTHYANEPYSFPKCGVIGAGVGVQYIGSCHVSTGTQQEVITEQFLGTHQASGNDSGIDTRSPHPSDLLPQYVPTLYIAFFYTAITVCLSVCTIMLLLYVYFRNEPAVKATSVSLSMLIFIGCYLLVLHTYFLNSALLPSLHERSRELRDCMCTLRTFLNGVGLPIALILSTLLVKLLRVYRLFSLKTRVGKLTTSNLALAGFVLLLTSPNALISLLWATADPYTSTVMFALRNGYLHITVLCVSKYSLLWTFLLLIYTAAVSLLLIVFAVLTRKIKYRDFKDTKKVSILSFLLVFTCATALFYWYLLRVIGADIILVHTVLQVGYYCIILQCQGFIFAPKLFPIVKERLLRSYHRVRNTNSN